MQIRLTQIVFSLLIGGLASVSAMPLQFLKDIFGESASLPLSYYLQNGSTLWLWLVHCFPAILLLLSIFVGWVTLITVVILIAIWSILTLQRLGSECCKLVAYLLQEAIGKVVLRHIEQLQHSLLQIQPVNANTMVYRARSELFMPQTSREESQWRLEELLSPTRVVSITNDSTAEDSN